ncbi:hypothetical protein G9F72_007290 [Clostridium estertheticum]|uniref:hypothetical protein n=1 Tax=Clostridium estertheticum TaxID=238834 RepID=UPI0013E9368F|nr:hypothetical protein [Clostridium estertheticum]MBZ9686136.1 hypothetical protein [Clostridium estertheticum]
MNFFIIKNTIKRYEPFTIKEVFQSSLDCVVHYAVFIDNDPFEQELGFDIIPIEYNYALGTSRDTGVLGVSEMPVKVVDSKDNYFLMKLVKIIEKSLKDQQAALNSLQNFQNEWLTNPLDDPIKHKKELEVNKKMILEKNVRINFIEASKKKFLINYPDYK